MGADYRQAQELEEQELYELTELKTKGAKNEHINTNTRAVRNREIGKSTQHESRKYPANPGNQEAAAVPF